MKRSVVLLGLVVCLLVLSLPLEIGAQGEETPEPTASSTLASVVDDFEPKTFVSGVGGTLSIIGKGLTSDMVVRLVNYGLLTTSYINEGALTAQVPPTVPPGSYGVRVTDGGAYDELVGTLTLIAPTPTPKPTAAPTAPPPARPGQPILTIRNYTVTPEQVRPGQEFEVAIEIYNNGSRAGENTLAIFPGGTFLPVGEKGHQLWQLHINATVVVTQKMRAPSSIGNGVHQLSVQLEANDWEGNNYKFPHTIPVEVIGASTGEVTGRPKVVIERAETEPAMLVPGEPFSLTLRLANRGSRTAVNVFASVASSELAIPASGGDTVYADLIRIDGVVTITLPLVLGSVDSGGRQSMPIALAYSDYSGGGHSEQQAIGIDVNTSLVRQPQLIIETYTTMPDFIAPGDTLTLTMRLANVGGGDAERVTVALGGEGGAALAPFVPLKAGNVIFVDLIAAGEVVELSRELLVDGAADAKAHTLPIQLAYDDARSTRHQETQRLSMIVRRRPELQASFYRPPDLMMVDMPGMLSVELLNVGRSAVNITEIMPLSDRLELRLEGLPFVGPLDPGGSAPVDLSVTPLEPGEAELVLAVSYRDDFNQVQVISQTLTVEVQSAPEMPGGVDGPYPEGPGGRPPEEAPPETLWQKLGRALKGFLGLGS